jgi:hypothetical protein
VYILDYWIRKSQCISFNFGPLGERESCCHPTPCSLPRLASQFLVPGSLAFSSLPFPLSPKTRISALQAFF